MIEINGMLISLTVIKTKETILKIKTIVKTIRLRINKLKTMMEINIKIRSILKKLPKKKD